MSQPSAPSPFLPLVQKLESIAALDAPGKAIGKKVRGLLDPGPVRDLLSGTWLGHQLHPLLTDVTIGTFVSATLLDVLGGDDDGRAAERLISTGIASYGATAVTGTTDWADSEPVDDRVRRVGLAHAAVNATALGLYSASLAARKGGSRGRGKALGLAGAGALAAGGYLGAHLSFVRGIGPNQTAFDEGPSDWTAVSGDTGSLEEGSPAGVTVGDTPVVLVRHGTAIHALHDRCSHRGCLLSDGGSVDGEIITCPCHGSQFDLRDGSVARGPAFAPQPAFAARERDGTVEVRLRQE